MCYHGLSPQRCGASGESGNDMVAAVAAREVFAPEFVAQSVSGPTARTDAVVRWLSRIAGYSALLMVWVAIAGLAFFA